MLPLCCIFDNKYDAWLNQIWFKKPIHCLFLQQLGVQPQKPRNPCFGFFNVLYVRQEVCKQIFLHSFCEKTQENQPYHEIVAILGLGFSGLDPQQSHVNCFNLKKKPDSSESDIEQKKQDMPLNMGLDPLSSLNSQTGSPKTDDTLRITHETTVKLSFKFFFFPRGAGCILVEAIS